MTQSVLDRLEELEKNAYQGKWETEYQYFSASKEYAHRIICDRVIDRFPIAYMTASKPSERTDADFKFIAAARNAFPSLLAEIKRLKEEKEIAREALERVNQRGVFHQEGGILSCPIASVALSKLSKEK